MSAANKNNQKTYYYSGGFAELVASPSPLTYNYFKNWFTGTGSVGKAMELLKLPYQKSSVPILEYIDGKLLVNLNHEEETLYKKTIFKYKCQANIHQTPQLSIDLIKIFHPVCLINTIRIIIVQSGWIASPVETVTKARNLLNHIPDASSDLNIEQIDQILKDKVWPAVIAIGLLCEFYNQLILKETKTNSIEINQYISAKIADQDWFFLSLTDQEKIKNHQMTFTDYIKEYGMRADIDYELTSPRWHEIPDIIKKRIENYESKPIQESTYTFNPKLKPLIEASINLHLLRSEAKKKVLTFFDLLRIGLLKSAKLTPPHMHNEHRENPKYTGTAASPISGKGISVSQGTASGLALHITNNDVTIPKDTIGIFPNASPEFALQYPKCAGMIFLIGGQTSHGSIVAREFGIPAIIDPIAANLKNGDKIKINGTTGEWKLI